MNITTRDGQITHLAVTHQIRRTHDSSVISAHCCLGCALQALNRLTLAAMMGENPPGPLEEVTAQVIDLATGEDGWFRFGRVPLDGLPPAEVLSFPETYPELYDDRH